MFPQPPTVLFRPWHEVCRCGSKLKVQKSRTKTVVSMTGAFVAREMLLKCPRCDRVFESEALRRLVPHRCNIAWDVRVHIGLRMFLQHCSAEQIHTELLARDVRLSSSEISYLGRKFIVYLAIAHRQATPRINRSMQMAGGYVLHLDAAHDADAPALMTGMDSLSRFVLGNVKIPSEHANHIVPFLKQLRHDYGLPIATVHDMGTGDMQSRHRSFSRCTGFYLPLSLSTRCRQRFARSELQYVAQPPAQAFGQYQIECPGTRCETSAERPTYLHAMVARMHQNR